MRSVYRVLISAMPPPFDSWISAHESELSVIESRSDRVRWSLGVIPLFATVFVRMLLREPRRLIGGTLMRTIVATLSVLNAVAGIGLAVLYFSDSNPIPVAVLSIVLLLQGCFTLAFLAKALGRRHDLARQVQLVGSTLALVVGFAGMLIGIVANLAATTVDPEYGPMMVAILLAMHGLFSLMAFRGEPADTSRHTTTA